MRGSSAHEMRVGPHVLSPEEGAFARTYRLAAAALVLCLLVLTGCASGVQNEGVVSLPGGVVRISDTGSALPILEKLVEAYGREHPGVRFRFESGTNLEGMIEGVSGGTLDLAVTTRPLSEDEGRGALVYSPFARDAVVFAANRVDEPVEGLSAEQVRGIYGGELTDWRQLGGTQGQVLVLDRNADEPARRLVLMPLVEGRPVGARTILLDDPAGTVEALSNLHGSIGYTSLGLLRQERSERVRILSLDGVRPTSDAVARNEYPWSLTLAFLHAKDAPPEVREFVEFVTGPEGRRVVEENGYVAA